MQEVKVMKGKKNQLKYREMEKKKTIRLNRNRNRNLAAKV